MPEQGVNLLAKLIQRNELFYIYDSLLSGYNLNNIN